MRSVGRFYLGVFLVALSTLAIEITLTRMLSVATWYHLAFFAISIAMLGMTAGAVTVYLNPRRFDRDALPGNLSRSALLFALSVPAAVIALSVSPLPSTFSPLNLIIFLVVAGACALPFYFSGIVISAALTRSANPTGKVYAADLVGAALGCLLVLGGLEVIDAPSLILVSGSFAAAASFLFAQPVRDIRIRRASSGLFMILVLGAGLNVMVDPHPIRVLYAKGVYQDHSRYILEEWNSFSRITVEGSEVSMPYYWGRSDSTPPELKTVKHFISIDGMAGSPLNRFRSDEDLQYLKYDVTNVAYALRPSGGACIIGVGGGRDVQSAVMYGHQTVVGIEINPILIRLLTGEFREFAGIADRPGISLVVDDGRAYLSRDTAHYAVIQMSMIDTWAATGAGAYSLSENALYTVEAWRVYFSRLRPDGIFTVSRWYNTANLGETGRIVALAVAALLERGVSEPSRHIALVSPPGRPIATLLVSMQPFSDADLARLDSIGSALRFDIPVLPGTASQSPVLDAILEAGTFDQLRDAVGEAPLNLLPPTDDNPYFFNMLRLSDLGFALRSSAGVLTGNLVATIVLIELLLLLGSLCLLTIVIPLLLHRGETSYMGLDRPSRAGAAYFSLIGAGFMFLEIGFIQRLSVFLGHPLYALGILLFILILSAGAGSYLSMKLDTLRKKTMLLLPALMVLLIALEHVGLQVSIASMIGSPIVSRIIVSILLIAPAGLLLGVFFPTGMRIMEKHGGASTPWFFALNGIFGVLSSVLAVFVSMYAGITMNFLIAGLCYALLMACIPRMLSQQVKA